jgi:hypothetical protein
MLVLRNSHRNSFLRVVPLLRCAANDERTVFACRAGT